MPKLEIDGCIVEVAEGASLLKAARKAGVSVPTLCYLARRSAISSCRVCVVEVEGCAHPLPACTTPARDGMKVRTDTPRLDAYRRIALELIMADHGISSLDDCAGCVAEGTCELQALCRRYGVAVSANSSVATGKETPHPYAADRALSPRADANPFLAYDPRLCIACQRCVGACNNAAHNHVLQTGRQGTRIEILAPFGPDWHASSCESCGQCAQACPTGALTEKRRANYRAAETHSVRTTCPHCGVGCQIELIVAEGRIVAARGADGPSNKGLLCVKGRFGSFDFLSAPDRLTSPLLRNPQSGELEPVSWDEALDYTARRFSEIKREQGSDSLAAFACSRSTNEDVYLLQKLARAAFGTNNVDSCARV